MQGNEKRIIVHCYRVKEKIRDLLKPKGKLLQIVKTEKLSQDEGRKHF